MAGLQATILGLLYPSALTALLFYAPALLLYTVYISRRKSQAAADEARSKPGKTGKVGKGPASKLRKALALLVEPAELVAVIRLKCFGALPARPVPLPPGASRELREDVAFCDDMLGKVSRSFSAVIRQLPSEMCLPVSVFYLVLRALDTVEDETDLSKFDCVIEHAGGGCKLSSPPSQEQRQEAQKTALRSFHKLLREEPEGPLPDLRGLAEGGVGKDDEARLLQEYHRVVHVCRALPAPQQAVIANICEQMGVGMADYVGRDMGAGTEDTVDYNRYCHIVAGLVGEGLTRQFFASGLERFEKRCLLEVGLGSLASDMGLFLQKTNIIRDYLEDIHDGRSWWPKNVWQRYAPSLGDFERPENRGAAVACLNELVADALELAPRSIAYLEGLENPGVFMFCAVPQVMAIMTLAELFGNPGVFEGVVKIRKPLAARILLSCGRMEDVRQWFLRSSRELRAKLEGGECAGKYADSDTTLRLAKAVAALEAAAQGSGAPAGPSSYSSGGRYTNSGNALNKRPCNQTDSSCPPAKRPYYSGTIAAS